MKKHSKKIALILVLALTLVAAIPALAANTIITGNYETPDIQVIIPTIGEAVINPYGLPVTIKADDGSTVLGKLTNPGQVATKPLIGYNMSEVDMKIGASVVGEAKGDFKLATAVPATTDTTKSGLIYLELQASTTDLGYVIGQDATTAPSTTVCGGLTGATALAALDGWTPSTYSDSATNMLKVERTVQSKNAMCTIKAATDSDSDGVMDTPAADGYFMARLAGNVVKAPKVDWVARDGFKTTITWIIEPDIP